MILSIIVNDIRMCFCKHDFEFEAKHQVWSEDDKEMPIKVYKIYRCKKCGFVRRIKL